MQNVTSPRNDDGAIEQEIQARADRARVTPANLAANIVSEHYFTAADATGSARRHAARLIC